MSTYTEDAQGNILSDPINETNTKYPWIPLNESDVKDAIDNQLDYQYMYNQAQPVSNIDTDVYDNYRNRVEELRTKTESYYEALESCLVPIEVEGMAFQPWEYVKETDSDGKEIQSRIKSLQYFFQDHPSNISSEFKEYCFRTDKVKFIDDRHRRLIYDRYIHILSTKEDEDNEVPFKDVILRTFFENNYCLVRSLENVQMTLNNILNDILTLNSRTEENEKLVVIDNGEEKVVESISDFDLPMQAGQDINTAIPSTLYNLYVIGWTHAAMIFLNGLAIEWTKIIFSVDNIDTFAIIYGLREDVISILESADDISMSYVHLPFKCVYMIGNESAIGTPYEQFIKNSRFDGSVPFLIDKRYGAIIANDNNVLNPQYSSSYYDRVICVDKNIVYAEFELNDNTDKKEVYLPDIGIQYCTSFRDFCNSDYRTKLKQFNFLGFEINKEFNNRYSSSSPQRLRTLKNNDFKVTWHPFNILDVKFKHLFNNRRVFKVFYNTKVLYDQDNILRIKNKDVIADEYERYRRSVTANIELYIREIYVLAKKDIGTYIVTSEEAFMQGYKYHYVTPYECFLLYNAIQTLLEQDTVTFDEFREINVINHLLHRKLISGDDSSDELDYMYPEYVYGDSDDETESVNDNSDDEEENYLGYLSGGFIVYDDDHNFFDAIVTESTLYDEHNELRSEIRSFWQSIINKDAAKKNLMDFLIPIDDVHDKITKKAIPSNIYYMYNGDNKGKIIPYSNIMNFYKLIPEEDSIQYDQLKLRFELSYIDNIEEGATPVDELIYYFDNTGLRSTSGQIVTSVNDRYTANILNALAYNIFKYDPKLVLSSIEKLNYNADYILPKSLGNTYRDDFIVINASESDNIEDPNTYPLYAKFFYNYGYYKYSVPHKIMQEWGLRRNLPEMFYWSLDNEDFFINSMHLLDEVFDFTYGFDKDYEANLRAGTNYILGYDADKLESSIKRGVVSMTKTGQWIMDYMNDNPAILYTSTDNFKKIQFNSNNDYIVTVNNERLYVYLTIDDSIVFYYSEEDGIKQTSDIINLKYKGQQSYTIQIDQINKTITDIDKSFTATYTSAIYNNETELVELYDSNDTLVVTLQADVVYNYKKLQMSRWNIAKQDNYVMVFKNRVLYNKYHSIHYSDIAFDIDMIIGEDVSVNDTFEFVFFLNANNTIISQRFTNAASTHLTIPNSYYSNSTNALRTDTNGDKMDKGLFTTITDDYTFTDSVISCNTDIISPEDVQLLISVMPEADDDVESGSGVNLAYELNHTVYSYRAIISNDDTEYKYLMTIEEDNRINGLYRVTKQGGGEYFLTYDGSVPPKTDTITTPTSNPEFIDYGYSTDRTVSTPYNLYLSSKRQFRYQHNTIIEPHEAGFYINLKTEFKYCVKNSHVLVFKNGLLLPPTYYFLRPIINTPIGTIGIVFNVALDTDDSIDIFYVTNDLHHLECDYYDMVNHERYIKNGEVRLNVNNNEYRVMGEKTYPDKNWRTNYIKMRSPLYAISSKNSVFVFLNGKKVRADEVSDISDTILSIDTDYARNGDDMQAVRLEVINHLDTQDIIERLYINDGLSHDDTVVSNQFVNTNNPNAYKNTLQIKSFSLTDLDAYAERCKLDEILNDTSDEALNKLFYNLNGTGPMTPEGELNEPEFTKYDVVISTIVEEFYMEDDGDKFIWDTIPTTQSVEGSSNTIYYIGDGESVRVPVRWNDEDTRSLYGTTFNRNNTLKKIVIPEGVTEIY